MTKDQIKIISQKKIAILDDDLFFAKQLKHELLERIRHTKIYCFDNLDLFIRVHTSVLFDICIFDFHDNSKVKLYLPEIRNLNPRTKIIFINEGETNSLSCISKNGSDIKNLISGVNERIIKMEHKTPIELTILSSLALLQIEKQNKHSLRLKTG